MLPCNYDDLHPRLGTIDVRQLADHLFLGNIGGMAVTCGPRREARDLLIECIQRAWDDDHQITQVTLPDEADEDCLAVLLEHGLIHESPS